MFAGKTTELLRRARELSQAGRAVMLVKSAKDTRYNSSAVTSHDGDSMSCVAIGRLSELKDAVGSAEYARTDVVAIDEAQFFEDLLAFALVAEADGKHLVVAGLDGDFKRQRFGQVLDLLPLADSVTKLAGTCQFCGTARAEPSVFTLRVSADERQELVGGSDSYVPVCRRHYLELSELRRQRMSAEAAATAAAMQSSGANEAA